MISNTDIRINNKIVSFKGHTKAILSLEWSINNQLASGGNDKKILIWNLLKCKLETTLFGHKNSVKALSWSKINKYILISGGKGIKEDKNLKIWNTLDYIIKKETKCCPEICQIHSIERENQFITCNKFHELDNNNIKIWNLENLEIDNQWQGHNSQFSLSIEKNEREFATCNSKGILKFWKGFNNKNIIQKKLLNEDNIIR